MIIVSACLYGVNCRFDGKSSENAKIIDAFKNDQVILVCPEELGGLKTPRTPCEIYKGTGKEVLKGMSKVKSSKDEDFTRYFVKGAEETLKIAKRFDVKKAILKSKSPSCGLNRIYNGNFDKTLVKGNGVTAQILIDNGIDIITENEVG
ncbi:purine nucleoside phosphorylase [Clostridium putrefaciens]|uniref:Purine nucleoside phosphorylase n=1 Tax=Clostridium putrefaciens TaxID=99675 RepID=A0A381J7A6_9CLOT|nr:DUF523 domain-containing protein [Clostridium putrefaciens]SUY46995.1 purine nucleoside phosphorylase [Clostridium putrefaciens]